MGKAGPLSKPSWGKNLSSDAAINFEGKRDRRDAIHDKIDPLPIKTLRGKRGLEIRSLYPIISLAHIQFKSRVTLFAFGIP